MTEDKFEMIAKTLYGLEDVLAEELQSIGAEDVVAGKRMVSFSGDKRMLYKANFHCRTVLRILKPVSQFKAYNADNVYEEVKKTEWDKYLSLDNTFAVDAVIFSENFNHSKYVAYRTKDAIVDYFNEKFGNRPSISIKNPDFYINIHISHNDCTVSLDSSGKSLHRRGYRVNQGEAPLSEVLAAGMILKTGWRGESNFVDPFCGSGTLLIEAAMIALNIAPGIYHRQYAFEKWNDFDAELFEEIYNDDSGERKFDFKCFGYDISPKAIEKAMENVKNAGLTKYIKLTVKPFQQFNEAIRPGILVTNPPYGERISNNDLLGLYGLIGERLKHVFMGYNAWILSYREEFFEQIGLRPKEKFKLMNGELECEFRCYELFEGKNREFKARTGERRNGRTEERGYGRTGERENGRTGERWNGRMEERENGRTGERWNGRTDERGYGRTGERGYGRTGERENGRNAGNPSFRGTGPSQNYQGQRDADSQSRKFENPDTEEKGLLLERSERHNRLAARHKGIEEKKAGTKQR